MSPWLSPQSAGKVLDPRLNDSAASCLAIETRPPTPEDVRRYRKSYFSEPGARIAHPGLINDLKEIDPLTKFGVVTTGSQHVGDVIAYGSATTEFQRIAQAKSEATYASRKREPLGKSLARGYALPAAVHKPDFAFGVSGTFGESAKELLYPTTSVNSKQDEELYKRSHGSVAPGEQKNREYRWDSAKIDPARHRFGVKPASGGSGGEVAMCLNPEMDDSIPKTLVAAKQVEDMRSTFDHLGKPRHLRATASTPPPPDKVFGVTTRKDEGSAWDCIQGSYSRDEQQPDADLGRPVNHGWRNATSEPRAFGVPSIRSDIPAPARRSIADAQNYGDDAIGKQLLYPEMFASYGVADAEFAQPRGQKQLRALFERIGYSLPDDVFALLWGVASRTTSDAKGTSPAAAMASVGDFRDALNDFLAARDAGQQALLEWQDRVSSVQ